MRKEIFVLSLVIISFLFMQGFQCSSPEMTTAKLAIRNQEYDKAKMNLEKELQKNPQNAEARIMLAGIYEINGDLASAARELITADPYITKPDDKNLSNLRKNEIWVKAYNGGIEAYNKYSMTQEKKYLDTAIYYFRTGTIIKPEMPDFYHFIGKSYEAIGDTNKAIISYNEYIKLLQPVVDICKEKKIYISATRAEVNQALGKPVSFKVNIFGNNDSSLTESYKYKEKDLFVYYDMDKEIRWSVFGIKYNPPENWLPQERELATQLYIEPWGALASINYDRKNYDKAIEYLKVINIIDPTNTSANSFLASIYEMQGRTDEGIKYLRELVDKNPDNIIYKAQLGDFLLRLSNYDDAIKIYQDIIKSGVEQPDIYRNLGAAYKNKVVEIQQRQMKDIDAGKMKDYNPEEYNPFLRKSAENFEKARTFIKYSRDYEILAELAEIYFFLQENEKLKTTVAELEAYEFMVPDDQKENYYLKMIKIYDSRLKNSQKSAAMQEKLKNLK